jgi:uncharacterized radical SAM superfamily Fe-S cluster-containing enzyme
MNKVYSHTLALCPECKSKVTARIIEKNGKVYLEKFCRKHGLSCALICSDVQWYKDSISYIKPGKSPLKFNVNEYKGCPHSCGFCPEHQQHTCLPVIEITDRCELNCPICLKDFGNPFQILLSEFENVLDTLLASEGKLNLINLSGGEPTLHQEFERFIALAVEKGVTQISVSTNGIKLFKNKNLRKIFKQYEVIVALQFDGFLSDTYNFLRGKDLVSQKLDLIKILEDESIKYSLVSTIAKGINDIEIKNIVNFFFKSKALSLMFQPITFTGKSVNLNVDNNRITIPDVIKEIEKSKNVKKGDFNPVPCSHFSCFAVSYYLIVEDGGFLSLKEFLGKEKYLDLITNRALPGLDEGGYALLKERIYELWSIADTGSSNEKIIERISRILREMDSNEFSPKQVLSLGMESMKAIFIHHFMDIHTLDFGRLIKCCNPYPQADGRLIPMCAQNIFFQ